MEFDSFETRARRVKKARKNRQEEPNKTCTQCDRLKPLKEFYKRKEGPRHSVCKECMGQTHAHCGCGCGRWPVGDMLYYVRVNLKPKQVGTYYKSQGCADKAHGINRRELERYKRTV